MRLAPLVIAVSTCAVACGSSSETSPSADSSSADARDDSNVSDVGVEADATHDAFDAADPFDASTVGWWFHERAISSGVSFTRGDAQLDSFSGRMAGGVCAFDANAD